MGACIPGTRRCDREAIGYWRRTRLNDLFRRDPSSSWNSCWTLAFGGACQVDDVGRVSRAKLARNEMRTRLDCPRLNFDDWKTTIARRTGTENRVLEFELDMVERAFIAGTENIVLGIGHRRAHQA